MHAVGFEVDGQAQVEGEKERGEKGREKRMDVQRDENGKVSRAVENDQAEPTNEIVENAVVDTHAAREENLVEQGDELIGDDGEDDDRVKPVGLLKWIDDDWKRQVLSEGFLLVLIERLMDDNQEQRE